MKKNKILEAQNEARQFLVSNSLLEELDQLNAFQVNSTEGLTQDKVEEIREDSGSNIIIAKNKNTLFSRFFHSFVNPFTIILIILATVSFLIDYTFSKDKNATAPIIIMTMVILSGLVRFIQEGRSNKAGNKLKEFIKTQATVIRDKSSLEINIDELVPGDIIKIAAGDMIPADIRILQCVDLFVRQSSMTGEAEPVEKSSKNLDPSLSNPLEIKNLAFMGTNVISGSATAIILQTGNKTLLGSMAKSITEKRSQTSFDKGVNSVSILLIRFMLVMVPIVFLLNGIIKGDYLQSLLFAMSIAVGLTPEMLPMIVTSNLAKGAVHMSKSKVIVKNLNAIQTFGSMDILCTDKTGTLTEDKIILESHLNILGLEDERVLRYAYANSYFQTGLKNLMDRAILEHGDENGIEEIEVKYDKIDEIPFDFTRRRMSVVLLNKKSSRTLVITKGAVEEMLSVSTLCELGDKTVELTDEIRKKILSDVHKLNENGMRVVAIGQKTIQLRAGAFSVSDESELTLMGYMAFLDPPKMSSADAIVALNDYSVGVKVLTGDNDMVSKYICEKIGLKITGIVTGNEIEKMDDRELKAAVENNNIFAKLSPNLKSRVVEALQSNGHIVGFMGDGINDAPAMRKADVGISVDSAVDIAKEAADIILLEKDLMVLEKGVIEGRKTFGNIIKYIKMTASSNFGNILSVLVASAFLPFLPMEPIQILLLGLIYDISCVAIVFDNADTDYLKIPQKWNAKSIFSFMLWFGPLSSIFDIITYLTMFFLICPAIYGPYFSLSLEAQTSFIALFHSGWFVESLVTQTLVIHLIRTKKLPFIQSNASMPVIISTVVSMLIGISIPFLPLASAFGFEPLPLIYFALLASVAIFYTITVIFVKMFYIKRYHELL